MNKLVVLGPLMKVSLVGGAGGAVYLSNALEIPDELLDSQRKIQETAIPTTIEKTGDIRIYERYYGCSFVFVKSWDSKETYNYLEFLKQHKDTSEKPWSNLVIKGADAFKNDCKQKKIITLSFNPRTNAFTYHTPSK